MALTALAIPSQVTTFPAPFDAMNAFTDTQVIAATGYLNNLNSGLLDLGGAKPVSAVGRTDGIWSLDITNMDVSSGDETYQFALLGSQDNTFANGNVELLAFYDFAAAAAGRVIATLLGASPTVPPTGLAGMIQQKPFSNLSCRIYYRFLKCRVIIGGTTPTVTVSSWISRAEIDV
jgi:hypothetical protein